MQFGIYRTGSKFLKVFSHDLLVLLSGVIIAADAHNRKIRRKELAFYQVVQRREELTGCKIAGATENHHNAGAGGWRASRWRFFHGGQFAFKLWHYSAIS